VKVLFAQETSEFGSNVIAAAAVSVLAHAQSVAPHAPVEFSTGELVFGMR